MHLAMAYVQGDARPASIFCCALSVPTFTVDSRISRTQDLYFNAVDIEGSASSGCSWNMYVYVGTVSYLLKAGDFK